MDLDDETIKAIRIFLDTGNTDDLPEKFQKPDYSILSDKKLTGE